VRWAAVEAIQRQPAGTKISVDRKRIEARRGKKTSPGSPRPASYSPSSTTGLRDGHIRALAASGRWREHLGRNTRAIGNWSGPRIRAAAVLIDPAFVVCAPLMPEHPGEGMTPAEKLGLPQPIHITLENCTPNTEFNTSFPAATKSCAGRTTVKTFVLAPLAGAPS